MKDVEIIGMLKAYIKASLVGVGALKGAPCQCVITENADGTHKVTMKWVDDNNVTHTDSFDVLNGQIGGFADISDVSLTDLEDGQVVAYNSTTQKWENVQNSATVNSLNNVGDVTISTVQDGQALVWSDILSKWVNKDVGITIDKALSSTSENPVQNKVLYLALEDKADKATSLSGYGITDAYTKTETDTAITAEIENLDFSDSAVAGSYVTAVSEADGKISVTREAADVTPTANSTKMLTSGGAKAALDEKQDTLTFDNAPTENSNNPVKSGGVFTSEQDIYEYNGVMGAKNLLENTGADTTTIRNVTFTKNVDGSVTANGTQDGTGGGSYYHVSDTFTVESGTYKLTGCPSGGSSTKYRVYVYDHTSGSTGEVANASDIGEGATFNLQSGHEYNINIMIGTSQTVNDLVFHPMIRLASDTDSTFQPYAKSNQQLTKDKAEQAEVNDIVNVYGSKNLLPFNVADIIAANTNGTWSGNNYTIKGVTFTLNDDGSVTVNGTHDGTSGVATLNLLRETAWTHPIEKITGAPSGSAQNYCALEVYNHTTSTRLGYVSETNPEITIPDTVTNIGLYIHVWSGQTVSNLTFYPMLRLASITDDTYEPYAKTNRELTSEQGYCTEDQYTAIQTLLS